MSIDANHRPATRCNRSSFSLGTVLVALALTVAALPHAASAATCGEELSSWTSGTRLVHSITSSSTQASELEEWDSDVVKIRHNIAGMLVLGAKGAAIVGTLYAWNTTTEEPDVVGTMSLGGGSGNTFTSAVDVGDYCLEIAPYSSGGYYELNVNFLDGCTLGTLSPTFCENQ